MSITIGIVGYGEVGGIFARGLLPQKGIDGIWAWDQKLSDPDRAVGEQVRGQVQADGVRVAQGIEELCAVSDLVISAVSAASTLAVAETAAPHVRPGLVFLDLNSASPGTKRQAVSLLEAAGARYVEAGVMASVPPHGIRVPMLLGGPAADALAQALRGSGMQAQVVSASFGVASAIKMSRSIMIKGLEALVIEAYATARKYGVEKHVLPTLAETFPQIDWEHQGAYFFKRVVQHGRRRAEEMREAARTVKEAGFVPTMAEAISLKQASIAKLAAQRLFEGLESSEVWEAYADRLIERGFVERSEE